MFSSVLSTPKRLISAVLIILTVILLAGWIATEWKWITVDWIVAIPFEPLLATSVVFDFLGLGFVFFETSPVDNAKRQSDIKMLEQLWQYISGRNLRQIWEDLDDGYGDYDLYREAIIGYFIYRETNAELSFYDKSLQSKLDEFDRALRLFDAQLSSYADAEQKPDGRGIWIAHYKLPRLEPRFYDYKLQEYGKAIELGREMLSKHQQFVELARNKYPEFTL